METVCGTYVRFFAILTRCPDIFLLLSEEKELLFCFSITLSVRYPLLSTIFPKT